MKYLPLILFLILSFAPMAVLADTADPNQAPIGGSDTSGSSFVPLTNIPGLTDLTTAPDLPKFLNTLYKLCIGVGAAIAVLQIMRAGIMYMGGDSVTEKKQARSLIGLSIGGLLLILTPYIVFSIINPKILDLNLDLSEIRTSAADLASGAAYTHEVGAGDNTQVCKVKGGTATIICYDTTKKAQVAKNAAGACPTGSVVGTDCQIPVTSGSDIASTCKQLYKDFEYAPQGTNDECSVDGGTVLPDSCCSVSNPTGGVCCAVKK